MAAMNAMSRDPSTIGDYMDDPDVRRLMEKFSGMSRIHDQREGL